MTKTPFSRKTIKPLALACSMLALSLQGLPHAAYAQSDQEEIAALRAQLAAMSARLEQLEARNAEMSDDIEETKKVSSSSSWISNVKISGDLRTRYENHDDSSKDSSRNRSRIRSRIGISAQVKDDWVVAFGLAGGGTDPISTNQTLGGGATTKDMRLDYAYFEYNGFDNTMITGGKYKNVFFKPGGHNLIYDGDYRPEGLGLKYSNNGLFINAANMFLESDDKYDSQDVESLWGLQAGYKTAVSDEASLTFGGSYYVADVKGSHPFYNGEDYRNTLAADGTYLHDYDEVELFAQLDTRFGDQPLRFFGDYVKNTDADDYDTGWAVGTKLGNVSGKGTWELGYTYQDLEADAIYAATTDSDFGGGGSDSKGHILNAEYGLGDNTELGITYYINKYGEASLGREIDFNRLHLWVTVDF